MVPTSILKEERSNLKGFLDSNSPSRGYGSHQALTSNLKVTRPTKSVGDTYTEAISPTRNGRSRLVAKSPTGLGSLQYQIPT